MFEVHYGIIRLYPNRGHSVLLSSRLNKHVRSQPVAERKRYVFQVNLIKTSGAESPFGAKKPVLPRICRLRLLPEASWETDTFSFINIFSCYCPPYFLSIPTRSNRKWRCTRNDPQRSGKETGSLKNQRTRNDHPDYGIPLIGQNTEKSPVELRRLSVTQTPVKTNS